MKKTILILAAFLFLSDAATIAQQRKELRFPDPEGYLTLKCDFHMHTSFSDGYVWPTERVKEAWAEGLDVIAITDHIEYRPNAAYIISDLNAPWDLARSEAEKYNMILIKGAEITRNMPPGHFNALFLDDVNALIKDNFMDAVEAAIQQDAFVFWNHPGWRQGAPDTPYWYPIHKELLKKGWMHGIEIVNWDWYYPEAHASALEYGLTMFGNSDIHGAASEAKAADPEWHRPMTLVFAKTRTTEGVREALKSGRTAVWYKQKLYAKEEFARPLVERSLNVVNPVILLNDQNRGSLILKNQSDLELRLKPRLHLSGVNLPDSIIIPPGGTVQATISSPAREISGIMGFLTSWDVMNVFTAPGTNLSLDITVNILFLGNTAITRKGSQYFLAAGQTAPLSLSYATSSTTPASGYSTLDQPVPAGMKSLFIRCSVDGDPFEMVWQREIATHKGLGSECTVKELPERKYMGKGARSLCDGILGTGNFRSGHWLGFYKDLDAKILLNDKVRSDSIEVRFMKDEDSWIFLPEKVNVLVSSDGKKFSPAKLKGVRQEGDVHKYVFDTRGQKIIAVKVVGVNRGECPPDHAGAGQPAWIFSDEIIIH
ncbi:MAG: Sb-PDE family phosphodiesterase [Bacteroidales bacterium]